MSQNKCRFCVDIDVALPIDDINRMSLSQKGIKIMTRNELITQCNHHLITAAGHEKLQDFDQAAKHMQLLLDLLLENLTGGPPAARTIPNKTH